MAVSFNFLNFVNLQTLRDKNYHLYQAEKVYLIYLRPIIVNYSFIVTRTHRKNLPQNAA